MSEVIVKIDGVECFLIPSFKNLRMLEVRTGERLLKIARRFIGSDYGVDDIAQVLYCLCDLKTEQKGTYEEFAEKVFVAGFMKYAKPVSDCLAQALTYGSEDSEGGNPKAGEPAR